MENRQTPINEQEQRLLDYLKMLDEMYRECNMKFAIERMGHLLSNGSFYNPIALPKTYIRMKKRECYANATQIALNMVRSPGGVYVEGFGATRLLPGTGHAWITTGDGNAIDPTWSERAIKYKIALQDRAYFGIEIKSSDLRQKILQTRKYAPHFTCG